MALLLLAHFIFGDGFASADPEKTPGGAPSTVRAKAASKDRETAALEFVREHHPELATLLEQLKPMKPEEYRKAIADLSQVSTSLAILKQRDPRRYEIGLEIWKAKSEVELLTAKWASTPSLELEDLLRKTLRRQVELEIRQQEFEQEQLRTRLNKVEDTLQRLRTDQDERIDSRFQALRKKAERARRPDGGKPSPAKRSTAKKGEKIA
ncbi:hypothetical protein ACYOEI_03970 [Singulisphaera rosea]